MSLKELPHTRNFAVDEPNAQKQIEFGVPTKRPYIRHETYSTHQTYAGVQVTEDPFEAACQKLADLTKPKTRTAEEKKHIQTMADVRKDFEAPKKGNFPSGVIESEDKGGGIILYHLWLCTLTERPENSPIPIPLVLDNNKPDKIEYETDNEGKRVPVRPIVSVIPKLFIPSLENSYS